MPTRPLDLPAPDAPIDATLHTPEGTGPWPGVLMLTDIMGPRPAFFGMADRLALAGYAVLLPNIYHHLGRAPVPDLGTPMMEQFPALLKLKATVTPARMRADARACLDAMATLSEVANGPVGAVGYCMSGQYAVYAAEVGGSRVAAAASYHGGELIRDEEESPHRVAAVLDCAFYFGHADKDGSVPEKRIPELDRLLSESGRDFSSEVYAGAEHGFAVPGPRHDKPSAERHWRTMLALFERTLVRG